MTNQPQTIPTILLLLLVLAPAIDGSSHKEPIPEEELGLSKESVLESPSPPPVMENLAEPGDNPTSPRAYPGSPPPIPHAIADMLPITRRENLCIECHQVEERAEGEPPPIPRDHFIDYRDAPAKIQETISGARHNCTTCHVARTRNEPLVGNRFSAAPRP